MQSSVAHRLATLIAAADDASLPVQSLYWSKIGLLDTMSVTLAGAIEDCARIATEATVSDDATGPSLIIGTRRRESARNAERWPRAGVAHRARTGPYRAECD